MNNLVPVAYAYLDHEGNTTYTSNLEGPNPELQEMSNYGRKGAMLALITEQQHRASLILIMGKLKKLLNEPIELADLIENVLKENMK
jgi:hypothetical protein